MSEKKSMVEIEHDLHKQFGVDGAKALVAYVKAMVSPPEDKKETDISEPKEQVLPSGGQGQGVMAGNADVVVGG